MNQESSPVLSRSPLHDLHVALGARMVPFAGYEMPLQYPSGILKEHLHTRAAAGLFDVSHMGQITIRARNGNTDLAAQALETLVPADIAQLAVGRQRYTMFTDAQGGILDDLMVARRDDHLFLVVNAACKDADEVHLRTAIASNCEIERVNDRALIALQGPQAVSVFERLAPEVAGMSFMDVREVSILGVNCVVSRSGYTGEDGFEVSVPASHAEELARALLEDPAVAPIGLGARDSLRLEAGLCLYGADLGPSTSPIEAALEWSIQKSRRHGGTRAGGFPGSDVILQQLNAGVVRRRVGLRPLGRVPVRAGATLYLNSKSPTVVGQVTSGGFGPSVNAPVAMGYVLATNSTAESRLFAEVRGARVEVAVCDLPFVPHRYQRR